MNCEKCKTKLKIINVFTSAEWKTQKAQCLTCKLVYTLYTGIVCGDPKHGEGADALARDLLDGKKTVDLLVKESQDVE